MKKNKGWSSALRTARPCNRGNALILVVTVMLSVFALASVSLGLSNYEMLATNSSVLNINGYALAEGGVANAERLFNEILSARFYSVSESAFDEILSGGTSGAALDLTSHGETDNMFKTIFGRLMDGAVLDAMSSAYAYELKLNDAFETEYRITVTAEFAEGGFEIISKAMNLKTKVTDTAIGRVEFAFDAGAEVYGMNSYRAERAGSARYEIKNIKKAFE